MFNWKEYRKQYDLDHREHINEYMRQYRKDNPKCGKKAEKQYQSNHREEIKQYMKQWRKDNKEHLHKYIMQWKENNIEEVRAIARKGKNKRKRNLGFNPLNEFIKGLVAHHINRDDIIYMPEKIHQSIAHCLATGKNMKIINNYAMAYLEGVV